MVMLSGQPRLSQRRRPSSLSLRCIPEPGGLRLWLADEEVIALPEGALWIARERALVVSDLHLEKGSALARSGWMLPPYDTRATLLAVHDAIARMRPELVVSLGDSFHDRCGPERMGAQDRAMLEALLAACPWIWIEGNHDGCAPERLGGRSAFELTLAGLKLRHAPTGAAGEVAGHLHPCARIAGSSGTVRRRCFAVDGERMVLPALGAFTGGLNVCDAAFGRVFPRSCAAVLLSRGKVFPALPHRLLAD